MYLITYVINVLDRE